jgi:hypothetical protein
MPTATTETAKAQLGETDEIIRALALKSVVTQSRGVSADETQDAGDSGAALREAAGNIATLEATAPTLIFGFRDEVVVRLRGTPQGTEVDVRSASEIGAHDLGQNARRVRAFFAKLDSVLQPGPDGSTGSGIASAGQ